MRVFFDTEFTDLSADARLISIGCASEDGQTFYVELMGYEREQCSDFVMAHVLPSLTGPAVSFTEAGCLLYQWLSSFEEPLQLVTDSQSWDWPWVTKLLGERWPHRLLNRPIIVAPVSSHASPQPFCWEPPSERHHALDDACTLRQAYLQSPKGMSC